ncbi:MAG: transglycosylase SLT domain-containing protein [Desulfovibrio sp.]
MERNHSEYNGFNAELLGAVFLGFFLFFLVQCGPAYGFGGNFYAYVDENGVTNYSNTIPSAQKEYVKFDCFDDAKKLSKTEIKQIANRYAKKYGLNPDFINAIIQVESSFNPETVSSAGAEGLMQIMPATQKELGVKDAFDPHDNIDAGIRYIKHLATQFDQVELIIAAYNAGPGAVRKYNGIPPYRETQRYVRKVLALIP